jgi:multimeric flavodoxin WrbA
MEHDDRRFLVLIGSARRNGNTEMLARTALEHVDTPVEWINLHEAGLPDFDDLRHTERRYYTPEGVERELLEATLRATDIVIASPLYMYSVSSQAKKYLDYWSGWEYAPGYTFTEEMQAKTLWGITVLSEDDHSVADPLVNTLRLSARWQKMRFGGVLLGIGNHPGDVLEDHAALERATTFFAGAAVPA